MGEQAGAPGDTISFLPCQVLSVTFISSQLRQRQLNEPSIPANNIMLDTKSYSKLPTLQKVPSRESEYHDFLLIMFSPAERRIPDWHRPSLENIEE